MKNQIAYFVVYLLFIGSIVVHGINSLEAKKITNSKNVHSKLLPRSHISGTECGSNPPTLDPNSGTGHVQKLGGLDAYVTGSCNSKLAIILASDIHGFAAPKLRKIADKVARFGYFVVVPDFFRGDSFSPNNTQRPQPVWVKDHRPEKGHTDGEKIINELKTKGISAVGAAGFCWGAKVVVDLAKSELIRAAVLLHPSFVTAEDFKTVQAPISVLGAEVDKLAPPKLLEQCKKVLDARPEVINSSFKVFPNVRHGWTVRYNDTNEFVVRAANEAHRDMIDWFSKYVR